MAKKDYTLIRKELARVSPEWLSNMMKATKKNTRMIANEFGVSESTISSIKTGARPISPTMRALLYYYFKNLVKES